MTRDDIIRIMREVCFEEAEDVWNDGIWAITDEELERFVAQVAAAEKELIAQWVESWGSDLTIKEIVEGIRTNGNGATRPLKYVTQGEPL